MRNPWAISMRRFSGRDGLKHRPSPRLLPRTATGSAIRLNASRTAGDEISPAWRIRWTPCKDSKSLGFNDGARSGTWVSATSPIRRASGRDIRDGYAMVYSTDMGLNHTIPLTGVDVKCCKHLPILLERIRHDGSEHAHHRPKRGRSSSFKSAIPSFLAISCSCSVLNPQVDR